MNSKRVFEHFNAAHPGGYYLLDNGRLGGGGQAEVFAGHKKGADDPLAIKILSPGQGNDIDVTLFKSEAHIMHELSAHPNIAAVHFSGEFEARTKQERAGNIPGTRYLFTVMDRAHGTLADEIQAGKQTQLGRIPTLVATQYLLDVIAGVGHAHGERQGGQRESDGVLHRDIKPANALLFAPASAGRPPHVQLADFGISRRGYTSASAITQTHLGAGTWLYADPRQFYPGSAIYAHDQYMAATTAWHVITGSPLFEEYSGDPVNLQAAHLQIAPQIRPLMTAQGRVDQIAEAAQHALLPALNKNPEQRYATMAEFGDALLEASTKAAEIQGKNRTIHPVGSFLGWQVPLSSEQTYLQDASKRYGLENGKPHSRRKILALAGLSLGAVTGIGYLLSDKGSDKQPNGKPSGEAKSPQERLDDAFNNNPPKLPELSSAEKAAVKESIKAVNGVIVKWLKKQATMAGSNHYSLERLITAMANHDAQAAYDLWNWLDALTTSASDIGGKADTKAWAAASLVKTNTEQMDQVLRSKAWADGGLLTDGSYTDADTVNACNRGVLGCALARFKPGSVSKVVDTYSGEDTIAAEYDDALRLALSPKQSAADRKLELLGFEQSAAAALDLAYENPDLLTNDMTAQESDWKLDVTLFSRALKALADTRPDYVQSVLLRGDLDSKVVPFNEGVTLEVALQRAFKNPEITQNVLKQRRSDAPKGGQSMLAMALAGYKPEIARAILTEQPTDKLLALSLDPTNSTLRDAVVSQLDATLSKEYKDMAGEQSTLGHASHLAIAFMLGQQRRL